MSRCTSAFLLLSDQAASGNSHIQQVSLNDLRAQARFIPTRLIAMLAVVALLPVVNVCHAQEWNLSDAVARPAPGAGHDYIHMLNETVTPANGGLSIKIDLPAPQGRGITLPFAIIYNSGDAHYLAGIPSPMGGVGWDQGASTDMSQSSHGWGDHLTLCHGNWFSGQPLHLLFWSALCRWHLSREYILQFL